MIVKQAVAIINIATSPRLSSIFGEYPFVSLFAFFLIPKTFSRM